jgi:hypothetical protein
MTQTPPTSSIVSNALAKIAPLAKTTWVRSRPTLLVGIKSLVNLGQTAASSLEQQIQAEASSPAPLDFTPVQKAATTFWTQAQPWWAKIIAGVRSRLDGETNRKLSDRALSGILSGMALLLLWLTTSLPVGPSRAAKPVVKPPVAAKLVPKTLAQKYPADLPTTKQAPFPSDLSAAPTINAAPTIVPTAGPKTFGAKPTVPTASMPPALPAPAKPVAIATQPVVKLTPEQQLLSGFQALGDNPKLLQSLTQDKINHTLRLTLNPDWYSLSPDKQDQLAADFLTKAQGLKVRSLQLFDGAGNMIARNPVVGNEMIILLRQAV